MKRKLGTALVLALVATLSLCGVALANDPESSTMYFEGHLEQEGEGFTGQIDMTDEGVYEGGGFDVYAEEGGTASVEGLGSWTIGADHDAYSQAGPWGSWYDPDCADWNQYSLDLAGDAWALRYTSTGESPMSGAMNWDTMYAAETDPGTVKVDHGGTSTDPTEYLAGSAQEWGWWCGWGEERIPLEYPGFNVVITYLEGDNFRITMVPAPAPVAPADDPTVLSLGDAILVVMPDIRPMYYACNLGRNAQDIDICNGDLCLHIPQGTLFLDHQGHVATRLNVCEDGTFAESAHCATVFVDGEPTVIDGDGTVSYGRGRLFN